MIICLIVYMFFWYVHDLMYRSHFVLILTCFFLSMHHNQTLQQSSKCRNAQASSALCWMAEDNWGPGVKTWFVEKGVYTYTGIPNTIIFSVFNVKTTVLTKEFQFTNPGDSYFYSLGLAGHIFTSVSQYFINSQHFVVDSRDA